MNIRYSILPYMYTLFYQAHYTGSTVMRALSWEFPSEPALASCETQFFLGPAILVTPVLAQGAVTVNGVFPGVGKGAVYYDWYNQSAVIAGAGENITIDAPLGHIPVYLRGGYIIPTQEPAMVTRDARKNPWSLIAALSLEGTAAGSLYVDDGESIVQNSTLYVEVSHFLPPPFKLLRNSSPYHTLSTYHLPLPFLLPIQKPTPLTSLPKIVHSHSLHPPRLPPRHLQ